MQSEPHACNDVVEPLVCLRGRNPQHLPTLGFEIVGLPLVPFWILMSGAVDLDDQPRRQTCEIGEVRSDRVLATKFLAGNTASAQPIPDPTFGAGHVASKVTGAECLW